MNPKTNSLIAACIALIVATYPISAAVATPPKRVSSSLGEDTNALSWNLFGPTNLISDDALKLKMSFQVACDNNASPPSFVAASSNGNDIPDAGGCAAGSYIFVVQIPSGPDNLEVVFKNLSNFTFNDGATSPTVGVITCDPAMLNTGLLCTNGGTSTTPPIPNMTITNTRNTEVTFIIPNIPDYPVVTGCAPNSNNPNALCHQGQGLTLFIETNTITVDGASVPISFPTIKLKK